MAQRSWLLIPMVIGLILLPTCIVSKPIGRVVPDWLNMIQAVAAPKQNNSSYESFFSSCSKKDDLNRMEFTSVKVSPEKPKKGDKVKISVDVDLHEEITSGSVSVSLKYGEVKLVDETLDLCDLIVQINQRCPLKKGKFSFTIKSKNIPDYLPSGTYTGKATGTDQNGKELFCLDANLTLE